jgi:hypothetical protein
VVTKQSQINAENIDLALLNEELRTARVKALSRCSRCGSFEHTARTLAYNTVPIVFISLILCI